MDDAAAIYPILQEWIRTQKLSNATLSQDGGLLSLADTMLNARSILPVSHEGKSCSYSIASIFLQLLDPNQGLLIYRNACKQYNVSDPVKALDKPIILGAFLGVSTGLASEAAVPSESFPSVPPPVATSVASLSSSAAAPATVVPAVGGVVGDMTSAARDDADDNNMGDAQREEEGGAKSTSHRHSKSDHHRGDRKKSSHKSKEHSSKRHAESNGSHHRDHKASASKPKKPKTVTNEQLFDSLTVVADKRQIPEQQDWRMKEEEIFQALSPKGFEITPELLEEHREKAKIIMANEIPVGNSASILRAANPQKDLSRVLELFNEVTQATLNSTKGKPGKPPPPPGRPGAGKVASTPVVGRVVRNHLLGKKPVIVVPKGMTAAITLVNAHEFLCNAKFVTRDTMVKQNRHRNPPTTFTRTVRGATGVTGLLEYEIVDNPRKVGNSEQDWDRIVAVIALGQSWQFKDWLPGYNVPATLFDKVYGYFVSLEGDKLPPEVSGWAVHQCKLNRDKRGLDQVSYATFWNGLDEWMRVHKPELLPQAET